MSTQTTPEPRHSGHAHHHNATAPIGSKCQPDCHRPSPSQAHCPVCHRSLSSVTAFNDHRCNGHCIDPAELGLVEHNRLWATPEGHDRRAADTARLIASRAAR